MAPGEADENHSGSHVEGGIRTRGPVWLIVVRQRAAERRFDPQFRLRAVTGLELRLHHCREHQRIVGWVQVEPDDVDDLLGKLRVAAELEPPLVFLDTD